MQSHTIKREGIGFVCAHETDIFYRIVTVVWSAMPMGNALIIPTHLLMPIIGNYTYFLSLKVKLNTHAIIYQRLWLPWEVRCRLSTNNAKLLCLFDAKLVIQFEIGYFLNRWCQLYMIANHLFSEKHLLVYVMLIFIINVIIVCYHMPMCYMAPGAPFTNIV